MKEKQKINIDIHPSYNQTDIPTFANIYYLTLCRSYLKPYCMGRKTAFFFQWAFNLHTKTRAL
jgi:hypothetical protein